MNETQPSEELIDVATAARLLAVSRSTAYRWLSKNQILEPVRIRHRIFVRVSDVDERREVLAASRRSKNAETSIDCSDRLSSTGTLVAPAMVATSTVLVSQPKPRGQGQRELQFRWWES